MKLVLDKFDGLHIISSMEKKLEPLPLAEFTQKEILAEWHRQRRALFLRLNQVEKLSYTKIAEKYKISRQAVGQLIGER